MFPTAKKISTLLFFTGMFLLSLFIRDPKNRETQTVERATPLALSKNVFVANEWDPLQEALVGSPERLTVTSCADPYNKKSCRNFALKEKDPKAAAALENEMKAVVKVLTDAGVRLYDTNPNFLSNSELFYRKDVHGIHFLCARSATQIIHSLIIEPTPPQNNRLAMKFLARHLLSPLIQGDNAVHFFSMPEPTPLFTLRPTNLDPADLLIDGKNIYVGYSGQSLPDGYFWLKKLLDGHFNVYPVNVVDGKRLDEVIALPNKDTVVYIKDSFYSLLPPPLASRKAYIIDSTQEAPPYLNDMILIDPKTAVVNENDPLLHDILKKAGYENVIGVPVNAIRKQGGNLRCLYAPLLRLNRQEERE